ncbi:hypothetical protein FB451DRAFT_1408835 [Mycena latifolia]|nr:hypothetical protein FB451DRAFT_1408835 [Mycena latifolia]
MPKKAKGSHVFRPAEVRSSSPDWDLSQLGGGGEDGDDEDPDGPTGPGASDDEETGGKGGVGPNDAEDVDENIASSSPVPSATIRKRTAAQSAPVYRKKPRLSAGAQAITDIAASTGEFNEIMSSFRDVFAASNAASATTTMPAASTSTSATPTFQISPQRRTSAIHRAQEEMWLQPNERVALVRILRDITAADTYNALLTDEMHIPWVIDKLKAIGIFVFHPVYSSFDLEF